MNKHHPMLCITPPHMLRQIIKNGSEVQRELALRSITISEQLEKGRCQYFLWKKYLNGLAKTLKNVLGILPVLFQKSSSGRSKSLVLPVKSLFVTAIGRM